MGFMNWDKKFETGIEEMDLQHKKWLDMLNSFYDQISVNNQDEKLKKLLTDAISYTKFHFQEEEKLMAKIGFPHLTQQKEMHSKISESLSQFSNEIQKGKLLPSLVVTREFKSWFKEHILVEDMKYAIYFKEKNK